MLKMIMCDKFTQEKIIFKNGLNVVVGDDIATNSIGKTTMLMIVDFVFGGDDYINISSDTVEHLGHHRFLFSFVFDKIEYFFIRDTETFGKVYLADNKFNITAEKDILEYGKWLKEQYKCENDNLSFRAIIGRYFRIYGKQNLNEHRPIQYFEKEKAYQSIDVLIQLFNKYKSIEACSERIVSLKENQKILTGIKKKEITPVTENKRMFNTNVKEIKSLTEQLEILKKEISDQTANVEALISQEILDLQDKKSKLSVQKNRLNSRLKRAESNIVNKKSKVHLEIDSFKEYFPNFNFARLESVNDFHNNITDALKRELKNAELDIRDQLQIINMQINEIDIKIKDTLKIKNAPNYSIDKLIKLSSEINQLQEMNDYYTKGVETKDNIKTTKETYEELKGKVTDDICNQINLLMSEFNKKIYTDERRSPNFSIHKDNYTFNTFGDTGTGTAFTSLICFDLAILKLTCLPALIHDLPLLKNIENEAFGNIVKLYCLYDKQIFIAIDKLESYGEKTIELVNQNSVLELSKDKILFIKNWKTE